MSHPNTVDVIRAWKDPEYRTSLSEAERATLLPSPVGIIDLSEAEAVGIVGGLDLANQGGIAGTSWKPMCDTKWLDEFKVK
ncbi:MAG: mersacidin/lichenicidin family type 2 lantibiotic [Gammaproteobacteria bacterium]